jgi:class 3 adenylate cyclase
MGGKVAKKLGDGLMALFGYPLTQENDLERTIRAALSIQRPPSIDALYGMSTSMRAQDRRTRPHATF